MNAVFADTSFYAAIVNQRDQLHARAKEVAALLTGSVVKTSNDNWLSAAPSGLETHFFQP